MTQPAVRVWQRDDSVEAATATVIEPRPWPEHDCPTCGGALWVLAEDGEVAAGAKVECADSHPCGFLGTLVVDEGHCWIEVGS